MRVHPGGRLRLRFKLRFKLECWLHRTACWRFGHGPFTRTAYAEYWPTPPRDGRPVPRVPTVVVEHCSYCFTETGRWKT